MLDGLVIGAVVFFLGALGGVGVVLLVLHMFVDDDEHER